MKIVEYFTCENRAHWLEEIGGSDWSAVVACKAQALFVRKYGAEQFLSVLDRLQGENVPNDDVESALRFLEERL